MSIAEWLPVLLPVAAVAGLALLARDYAPTRRPAGDLERLLRAKPRWARARRPP